MSRELNALKQIGEYHIGEKKYGYDIKETRIYGIVEQALKVLEIIKRNPTHIYNAFCKFPTYFAYKDYCEKTTIYKVTQYIKSQEEWDLVKEVLL